MSHIVIQGTLASSVADSATFAVSYPDREGPETGKYCEGDFHLGVNHKLVMAGNELSAPKDFTVTINATNITITNITGATWPTNSVFYLEMQQAGKNVYRDDVTGLRVNRTRRNDTFIINLGSPDVMDPNGICEAQNIGAAGDLTINGALASGGVVTLDVPRNVTVDSGGADDAVLTVHGFDEYGVAMSEAITLNGTTEVVGKKAFKTITRVAASKAIANSAFVGNGKVLGLPVFVPHLSCVLAQLQDAAAASAGTTVAGLSSGKSTTTTADVRGTYTPAATLDGEINLSLVVSLPDPGYLGTTQA